MVLEVLGIVEFLGTLVTSMRFGVLPHVGDQREL